MISTCRFLLSLFLVIYAPVGVSAAILLKEDANNLRPTQAYVGMAVVDERAKKLEALSKGERQSYLRKNPVPVVIGPGGEYYMIDRHHLSLALIKSGHKKLYLKVVEDWSHLTVDKFWQVMEEAKYSYLYDSELKKIAPSDLPKHLTDLKNDLFRSLAYYVRTRGGFEKTDVSFAEFYWASFFKKFISIRELTTNWDRSVEKAVRLSHSRQAIRLPGYFSVKSCNKLLNE